MKFIKTTIIVIIFINFACNKPCNVCHNICYKCQEIEKLHCSTNFNTINEFYGVIDILAKNGIKCNLVNPTIEFNECDQKKIKIFKNEEFICDEI